MTNDEQRAAALDAIRVLNEINDADPTVLARLFAFRVPCNEAVANHPSVQVGITPDGYDIGALGLINGLFGTLPDSYGHIAGVITTNATSWLRFEPTDPTKHQAAP